MITLERARYLCNIDDNDEPTATRDTITAITEAQDALDRESRSLHHGITPSPPSASYASVLLDYLMGHMRERDPAMHALLRDWS